MLGTCRFTTLSLVTSRYVQVQSPITRVLTCSSQDHYLQQVVSPLKDVEGLHFAFHYNLYHKFVFLLPQPHPQTLKRLSLEHSIRYIKPASLLTQPKISSAEEIPVAINDQPPPGTVKSILPCTPLAIVKCLEHAGVYNRILPYGDRAYGRVITVINRYANSSEVKVREPTNPL
jgi:methylenetetrahydrofolate dehydrogenase (NAD+)